MSLVRLVYGSLPTMGSPILAQGGGWGWMQAALRQGTEALRVTVLCRQPRTKGVDWKMNS